MRNEYCYNTRADLQAFIDEHGVIALVNHGHLSIGPGSDAAKYLAAIKNAHDLREGGVSRADIQSLLGNVPDAKDYAAEAVAVVFGEPGSVPVVQPSVPPQQEPVTLSVPQPQQQAEVAAMASKRAPGTFPYGRFETIARAAIARGEKRVLPIKAGGKNPAIKWVDALPPDNDINTMDSQQWAARVESWVSKLAQQFPDLNACVIAKPQEFCFIDCDTYREFIAGYEAFAGEKFQVTYTTAAQENRTQIHFRQTDATRELGNVPQFAVDGIDLSFRQRNEYVLAEGSQHPKGTTYECIVHAPIALMPDKMVAYIHHLLAGKPKVEGAAGEFKPPEFRERVVFPRDANGLIPDGYRHNATLQELGDMHYRKEFADDVDAREEALIAWREKNVVNPRSEAQDKKVRAMVESSMKWAPSTRVTLNMQPDPEEQARAAVLQAEREQQRRNERLQELLEYTDVQNAELFVRNNKDSVRANFGGSKGRTTWYWWDGARWKEDSAGKVVELAKQTAVEQAETVLEQLTEAFRSGDEEQQKTLAKRCKMARECCSDHRIHSMLNLAAAGTEISVVMTQLDGQPNLVNFKNGTLDLDAMELRPHRKEDLLTQLIPINYDPNAKCPKWEAFVERIFRDKPYMPDYLQRVVGYFLTGRNPEQVFFIFYGLPGGGKTTLRNVLKALIGEYAKTCPQGMFLMGYRRQSPDAPSPSHADLYGARLVLSEELDEDEKLDCRMVKMVSGGGEVKARPLYKPPFEYAPDYKLLFLTNHTPKISDFSGAIDDRLRVVKMEQRLRDTSEEVQDYHTVLMAELPGILAWAIRGLKEVKARGLQDPKEVRLMTQSFMQSENVVQEWLDERTEQGEGAFITASEAHRDFVWWAKQRGEDTKPMTPRWFGLRMSHLGWVSESGKSGTARGYHGLKLRPQPGAITLSQVPSKPVSFDRRTPVEAYDVEPERVN